MSSEFEYKSDNIIVGSAELPAVRTKAGVCWVLPGHGIECDREVAEDFAEKLDQMISKNLRKFSRRLFQH